jgi:hypothetical protein
MTDLLPTREVPCAWPAPALAGWYCYLGILPLLVHRYGRCCMYGPNYVKLSRVFAVQLFGMLIGHYAALPPVRSDPHWSHSNAITASIRIALTHALQHPLLATNTSTVATTTCLG